jgi:hypothetical protein
MARLRAVLLAGLVSGCSLSNTRPCADVDLGTEVPVQSVDEAARLAADAASRAGYRLADYHRPRVCLMRENGNLEWSAFFQGKSEAPGHVVLVIVGDASRSTHILHGE